MKETILKAIEIALSLCHMCNNTSVVVPAKVIDLLAAAAFAMHKDIHLKGNSPEA